MVEPPEDAAEEAEDAARIALGRREPPQQQAEPAHNAPAGAGTVPTPGNGSLDAPEATPDAAVPVPSADLAARAELLAALAAEAAEES